MLRTRELIGFALAPLPVIAPLLLMFGLILSTRPDDSRYIVRAMLELVFYGYAATLLFGVPVHLILRWRRRNSLMAYVSLAVATILFAAAVLGIAELIIPPSPPDNPFRITMWSGLGVTLTLGLAVVAALGAWIFWRIAVRQARP